MFYPQHAQASTGTRPPLASQPHLGGGVVLEQAAGADILPDHGQALVAGLGHDRPLTHSSCHDVAGEFIIFALPAAVSH